ncbi:hypothetical protein HNP40_002455 [Mycobacteroides chelonae]|nr:hypothetical protein [Mycobacteroides chelonae]
MQYPALSKPTVGWLQNPAAVEPPLSHDISDSTARNVAQKVLG